MDLGTILLGVGILAMIILGLMVVKKVISAVLSIFLLIIAMLGVLGIVVYLDISSIVDEDEFEIVVVYEYEGEYVYGVNIPVEDWDIRENEITRVEDLSQLSSEEFEEGDNGKFLIEVSEEAMENLTYGQEYSFDDYLGDDLNLTVEGERVNEMVNMAHLSAGDFLTEVFDADLTDRQVEMIGTVESQFEDILGERNLGPGEVLFLTVLVDSAESSEGVVKLLENYKDENIKIYPDRPTFTLIRWLPVGFVANYLG